MAAGRLRRAFALGKRMLAVKVGAEGRREEIQKLLALASGQRQLRV
jgi:hypothetical protein